MNESAVTAFLEKIADCDIFVLIVWKTLSDPVRLEFDEAIKLNKPILVFTKLLSENEERSSELQSWLNDQRTGTSTIRQIKYKEFRTLKVLSDELKRSVIQELNNFFQDPVFTLSREEMYNLGTAIIKSTQKRLYVVQKTPSLILGVRPYLAEKKHKNHYDATFTNELLAWIDKSKDQEGKEFSYFFSLQETQAEIKSLQENREYATEIANNIAKLDTIQRETAGRFRFCALNSSGSGPMIVGDTRYAIWITGNETAFAISQNSPKLCDALARILKVQPDAQINNRTTLKDLLPVE